MPQSHWLVLPRAKVDASIACMSAGLGKWQEHAQLLFLTSKKRAGVVSTRKERKH
jgi:hypothetical protein